MMRIALDTNILAYAEGVGDEVRCSKAIYLLERLPGEEILIPAQTLGELFRVLTGKAGRAPMLSREAIISWADSYEVAQSSWASFQAAMDLAVDHKLQIWDALIMAVAAENQCRLLLSEDLQTGFIWRGITVVNPFDSQHSPLLEKYFSNNS
jgi:predicted nucleic acid-binding protein